MRTLIGATCSRYFTISTTVVYGVGLMILGQISVGLVLVRASNLNAQLIVRLSCAHCTGSADENIVELFSNVIQWT